MKRALEVILALILGFGLLYVLIGTLTEDRSDIVRPRSEASTPAPR
jgi:hypothetical protein